jgi:SAGA-associated factor 29
LIPVLQRFYTTTLQDIIPLPDPNTVGYLHAYPEFPAGSTVMALYPDTSCFYRAEVIASPRDMQPSGRVSTYTYLLPGTHCKEQGAPSTKYLPTYKLKFEDDDDQEHSVAAQWVVEWPGS